MDLARLVQQIGNMLFRRMTRRLMNQAMRKMSGPPSGSTSGPARRPEEKAQAREGKAMQRRANQTMRFLRRLGR